MNTPLNFKRALEYMHQSQLDALIATSPINVTYFSDYFCWLDPLFKQYMMNPGAPNECGIQTYAVLTSRGKLALIVPLAFAANAADLTIDHLGVYGEPELYKLMKPDQSENRRFSNLLQKSSHHPTAIAALIHFLNMEGLKDARLGIEIENLIPQLCSEIKQALPKATLLNSSNLIRLVRMVKSPEEISRLTKAAQIAEEAANQTLSIAKNGASIKDLIHHFRVALVKSEADFDHFAFGPNGWGFGMEIEYHLSNQDLYIDFGCVYKHYYSDSGMTLALHPIESSHPIKYQTLLECIGEGIKNLKPGIRSSEVHNAMQKILRQQGIKNLFPHGHGIGLEVRDYPILVPENQMRIQDDCVNESSDIQLEPNMVVNLEVSSMLPNVGSMNIEQTFLITDNDCRLLVPQNREQPFVPQLK